MALGQRGSSQKGGPQREGRPITASLVGSEMCIRDRLDHYLGENQAMLLESFLVAAFNPLDFVGHKLAADEARLIGPALAVAIGLALDEVKTR